jgi:hypothetical protein
MTPIGGSTVYTIKAGNRSWTGMGFRVTRTQREEAATAGEPEEWLSVVVLIAGTADLPADSLSLYAEVKGFIGEKGAWYFRCRTSVGLNKSMVELGTMKPVTPLIVDNFGSYLSLAGGFVAFPLGHSCGGSHAPYTQAAQAKGPASYRPFWSVVRGYSLHI